MSEKLKKCPFCGSDIEEIYKSDPYPHGRKITFFIECVGCIFWLERKRKKDVIKAWNKRAKDKEV